MLSLVTKTLAVVETDETELAEDETAFLSSGGGWHMMELEALCYMLSVRNNKEQCFCRVGQMLVFASKPILH